MTKPSNEFVDEIGHAEKAGIEFIPEEGRSSNPRDVFAVFLGSNLGWSVAIYGWIPITLGLNFWSAITSSVLGIAIGTVITAPLATYGPRSGTNMTVCSSAVFGIRGRLIGSVIGLLVTVSYTAVVVWTSGDAIVASIDRLLGTTSATPATVIAYALVSLALIVVAVYGHATIVALQKFIIPVVGVILLLGFFAFAGHFDGARTGGDFSLGSFWPTWVLSLIFGLSAPISYSTQIGDYTRRISGSADPNRLMLALGAGLFLGLTIPVAFGAFTAAAFEHFSDSYMTDIVNYSPAWYVVPIIIVAILGGMGQGVLCVYSTGLDLESFIPRLNRITTTAIAGLVSVILVFVAVYAFNAVDAVLASQLLINALLVPWTAIMVVFLFLRPPHEFDVYDLQAFAQRRRGGIYWFKGGFFWVTVLAWIVGSAWGVMTVNASSYVGPWSDLAGGIDVSIVGSMVLSSVVYLVGLTVIKRQRTHVAAG